jgi:hypothetical protein
MGWELVSRTVAGEEGHPTPLDVAHRDGSRGLPVGCVGKNRGGFGEKLVEARPTDDGDLGVGPGHYEDVVAAATFFSPELDDLSVEPDEPEELDESPEEGEEDEDGDSLEELPLSLEEDDSLE